MKCLFLNNENVVACLPSYLRINNDNLVKKKQVPDFGISYQQYVS